MYVTFQTALKCEINILGIEQTFNYCLQVRPIQSSDVNLPQSVVPMNDILCFYLTTVVQELVL